MPSTLLTALAFFMIAIALTTTLLPVASAVVVVVVKVPAAVVYVAAEASTTPSPLPNVGPPPAHPHIGDLDDATFDLAVTDESEWLVLL